MQSTAASHCDRQPEEPTCTALFGTTIIVVLVGLHVGYVILSEIADLAIAVYPSADVRLIPTRMSELAGLWTAACLLYGWAVAISGHLKHKRINVLTPSLVPLILGWCHATYNLWVLPGMFESLPAATSGVAKIVTALAALLPGMMGCLEAYAFVIHKKLWTRYWV